MSEAPYKYRRLPGSGRRTQGFIPVAASRSSLWLGQDHLLGVDRIWMNEEYKRFYFHDIQAITVERTNSAAFWSWGLGTFCLLSALLFGLLAENYPSSRTGFLIAGGIVAGFWLILLLVNLLRGSSCVCRLRTAVQTEVLPSLGRTGKARKAIAILKPLIEQTQGVFTPGAAPLTAPLRPLRPAKPGQALPAAIRPSSGLPHLALFATLILDAAAGIFAHLHPAWRFYSLSGGLLMMTLTALSFTALLKQRDTTIFPALQGVTKFTFVANLVCIFIVFIYGMISRTTYAMRHPGQLPSRIDFYGMPGFKTGSFYLDLAEFLLGFIGLIMAAVHLFSRGKKPLPQTAAPQDQSQPIP